jgi:hypothetical protein
MTSYERRDHGTGLVSWTYEYWNPRPLGKSGAVGAGLEIGVQLAGEWLHAGARHGKRSYGAGEVHRIDPGELYDLSFTSPSGRGVQVGFIVYPDEIGGLQGPEEELRFRLDAGAADPELVELCRDRDRVERGRRELGHRCSHLAGAVVLRLPVSRRLRHLTMCSVRAAPEEASSPKTST